MNLEQETRHNFQLRKIWVILEFNPLVRKIHIILSAPRSGNKIVVFDTGTVYKKGKQMHYFGIYLPNYKGNCQIDYMHIDCHEHLQNFLDADV